MACAPQTFTRNVRFGRQSEWTIKILGTIAPVVPSLPRPSTLSDYPQWYRYMFEACFQRYARARLKTKMLPFPNNLRHNPILRDTHCNPPVFRKYGKDAAEVSLSETLETWYSLRCNS